VRRTLAPRSRKAMREMLRESARGDVSTLPMRASVRAESAQARFRAEWSKRPERPKRTENAERIERSNRHGLRKGGKRCERSDPGKRRDRRDRRKSIERRHAVDRENRATVRGTAVQRMASAAETRPDAAASVPAVPAPAGGCGRRDVRRDALRKRSGGDLPGQRPSRGRIKKLIGGGHRRGGDRERYRKSDVREPLHIAIIPLRLRTWQVGVCARRNLVAFWRNDVCSSPASAR